MPRTRRGAGAAEFLLQSLQLLGDRVRGADQPAVAEAVEGDRRLLGPLAVDVDDQAVGTAGEERRRGGAPDPGGRAGTRPARPTGAAGSKVLLTASSVGKRNHGSRPDSTSKSRCPAPLNWFSKK